MMRETIWKFTVSLNQICDVTLIDMPKGAEVISVVNQREELTFYAKVNSGEKETEIKKFRVAGTGHSLEFTKHWEMKERFIGTVLFMKGDFVLHVYELSET